MTKIWNLTRLMVALGSLASAALSQTASSDVHVKLTLADNKTTYRIGEAIKLILEFTADRDGYQADTNPDRSEPTSDSLVIAPDSGVCHWLDELNGNRYGGRDVFSHAALSTTPIRVELVVNDTIRIDQPGRYSARVITRRVTPTAPRRESRPAIVITTNEVSFDVQPMSDDDEAKEVKRLSDRLDATHDWRAEEEISKELSFLTGDGSSREKVRRFLNSDSRSGNYAGHIYYGLFIARNRELVLQLLETAMRDPNTPVSLSLLGVLTSLRFLQQNVGVTKNLSAIASALEPEADPRIVEIREAYVRELAAGLAKRTGKSRTTTAITILTHLPNDPGAAHALLSEARRVLAQEFENLHPYDQEYLLRQYWDQFRDPSMVPSLKKILNSTDMASKGIQNTALKRLIEISPDEARPYVVAEIKNLRSFIDLEILGSLGEEIPEVDSVLLEQIRSLASSRNASDQMYLKEKLSLAVRYATNAIYQDLMQIYRDSSAKLSFESRACLLAYLAKNNEHEALPLIEQALNEIPLEQEFNFLPALTHLFFSDAIDALLRKRLESDEQEIASTAAYLISLYGSANDQKAIESRLERWRKEWTDRRVEADTNLQGRLESELISALTRSLSWKLPPERVKELRQSCVTKLCHQNFPNQ